MKNQDQSELFQSQISTAYEEHSPLQIRGGKSKAFYHRAVDLPELNVSEHRGILNYEPTELIITARAGTPLSEIEQVLAEQNQMLPFEPPHFGPTATLGGTIACGLSGPRRVWTGSARDFVLGVRIINGKGEIIHFGGEVMKNVAGYDVSRLMTGAMGTLGLLLDISLKVLPKPGSEITLSRAVDAKQALQHMIDYNRRSLPVSAMCHDGDKLHIRLSGAEQSVQAAKQQLGGIVVDDNDSFWASIREQQHVFFNNQANLWRVSLPAATPVAALHGQQFIDWGGAQRWLYTGQDADSLRSTVEKHQGHATLFRSANNQRNHDDEIFHPLHGKMKQLQMNLKLAMDPHCVLNPTMMYSDF